MPGFVKLQSRWQGRGVQFVGIAHDDPAKVAAFGREHLAGYKAPKIVYLTPDFPRTKNGKIIRKQLRPETAVARSA